MLKNDSGHAGKIFVYIVFFKKQNIILMNIAKIVFHRSGRIKGIMNGYANVFDFKGLPQVNVPGICSCEIIVLSYSA